MCVHLYLFWPKVSFTSSLLHSKEYNIEIVFNVCIECYRECEREKSITN